MLSNLHKPSYQCMPSCLPLYSLLTKVTLLSVCALPPHYPAFFYYTVLSPPLLLPRMSPPE